MRTPERPVSAVDVICRVILVAATLICLASIGGAMAGAAPILLPLLWLAARHSGTWGRGAWISLAALSAAEAAWIYAYWLYGRGSILLLWMPIAAAVLVVVIFTGTLTQPDGGGSSFPREVR